MSNYTRNPNFLIVGAPKCGTTSLYHYLKGHPEIYMSTIKEPRFITAQFLDFPSIGPGDHIAKKRLVKNFNEYCNLFNNVTTETAIGEASADSLYYYKQSIPIIKKYLGDVKIIIIVRNPIDRTFSNYIFFRRQGREFLSFEDALDKEGYRIDNDWLFGWYYTKVGFYFKQIEAFLNSFSKVKVLLFDELKNDPNLLLKNIYQFLNVDTQYIPINYNVKYNVSGIPRFKLWHKFFSEPNIIRSSIIFPLRKIIPSEKRMMFRERLIDRNLIKPKMNSNTRLKLKELFRKDILLLESLLSRDLSHWLK